MVMANGGAAITDGVIRPYTLLALCENAALLPLFFNVDTLGGTLAVEHSLPPIYYGHSVTGSIRGQMIADLLSSGVFAEVGA